MKNILHITNHIGTIKNIENMCNLLNLNLTTQQWDYGYYINETESDIIWNRYEKYIDHFDYIIFTDTSMIARPFLQNIEKHKATIIIYITNRFNWGIWGFEDKPFYNLYSSLSTHERVFFSADNKYDMYFSKLHNIFFKFDNIIRLIPNIPSNNIIMPINDKFFIYNRGTKIENYRIFLDNLNIKYDIYGENHERFKDQHHICEYTGIIHMPYQTNIQSLYENLAYNIIYFIPSKQFIFELINNDWYYWEEKNKSEEIKINSILLSEWYLPENETLFIYFDNWEQLKEKTNIINIAEKKALIQKHMEQNQLYNINSWGKILK
jgi:hypothetical protein